MRVLLLSALIVGALAYAVPRSVIAQPTRRADHEHLAKGFRETFGLEGRSPEECAFQRVFDEKFVRAQIGLIDLRVPAKDLTDKKSATDFGELVRAMIMAQEAWIDWMEATTGDVTATKKDIAFLLKETKRFKASQLPSAVDEGGLDYFTLMKAKPPVLEALDRFAEVMGKGTLLGLDREERVPAQVILFPRRADFVSFVSFIGWQDATKKPFYWVQGTENWNECFLDATRLLPLEFANPSDHTRPLQMNAKNNNEMAEQVSQLALNSLFDNYYGAKIPAEFASGLSMNLVIHIYGELDTRLDGDLSSNETNARQRFIPGGRSEGGNLPENSAKNRWRVDQGKDHFVRPLRQSQKSGAADNKGEKNKLKSFQLKSRSEAVTHVVTAPVFGSAAMQKVSPPAQVMDDYRDFLRSYKSAFLYWLREESDGQKKSPALFAELLRKISDRGESTFAQVIEEHFGVPLSSKELGKEDLEGRFLRWLGKKR